MRKLQFTILLFSIVIIHSCKKNHSSGDTQPQVGIVDTNADGELSKEALAKLELIPSQHATTKDVILPNGEILYDYIKTNYPDLLNTKSIKINATPPKKSDEEERISIIGLMQNTGIALTDYKSYADKIKKLGFDQPLGLAYVYNGKNPNIAMVSAPNDDGTPASCQEKLFGLDCSGFLQQLMMNAGINFQGNAATQATASNWNASFKKLGYENLTMQRFEPGTITQNQMKSGDIIFWIEGKKVNHIGAIYNYKNQLTVFISNGTSRYSCEKNKEKGPVQNLLSDQIDDMVVPPGILRIVIQSIKYTGATSIPQGASDLAAAGADTKLMFAGGNIETPIDPNHPSPNLSLTDIVNVYDTVAKSWTYLHLAQARYHLAGAAAGKKILFAGGLDITQAYSGIVDLFDVSGKSITHTTASLSVPRARLTAAAAGNLILFAGGDIGSTSDGNGNSKRNYVSTVDIYDASTGKWLPPTSLPSGPRRRLAAAAAGNIIMFAGGQNNEGDATSTVDIYDVSKKAWVGKVSLSQPKYDFAGAGAGSKIVFAGGGSNVADVFDISNNFSRSTKAISSGHSIGAATAAGNFVVIAGDANGSTVADIYNVASDVWTKNNLRGGAGQLAAASTGYKIIFGGGSGPSATVDIFTVVLK